MRTSILTSFPGRALIDRMREETRGCDEFWAASAFVSHDAVLDVLDEAGNAHVKILTGTMGNSTRKKTFKALLQKAEKGEVEVRIWDCGRHRDFHMKLNLWRRGNSAVAWIGSANLTDGGLTNAGELMLEIRAPWSSSIVRSLTEAFRKEWGRGDRIKPAFVDEYVEAKRSAPGQEKSKRRPPRMEEKPGANHFAMSIEHHFKEGGEVVKRIERLLGTDEYFVQHHSKTLASLKPRDRGILVDQVDKTMSLVEVIDSALL